MKTMISLPLRRLTSFLRQTAQTDHTTQMNKGTELI